MVVPNIRRFLLPVLAINIFVIILLKTSDNSLVNLAKMSSDTWGQARSILTPLIKMVIDNNSLRCPTIKIPIPDDIILTQNRWQTELSNNSRVYLYSAIYDDRTLGGPQEWVRINLVAIKYSGIKMYCHFWYKDYLDEAFVLLGVLNETSINKFGSNEGVFAGFILSCPVPLCNLNPSFVSVTETVVCKHHQTFLPVIYQSYSTPPIEFGLCVVNGFGKYTPSEMVEWFEFYRLMGVQEFNLYNSSYEDLNKVFNHYIAKNVLVLSQIPHPHGPDKNGKYGFLEITNLASTCLNDCLMKNMYRYRYIVIVDHDEFIVPRDNITNYHDLLINIEEKIKPRKEIMSYSFLNTYFLRTFPPDHYKPVYLKTLRYRFRTKPMGPYVASKSILKPLFCFNLMNHYCYNRLHLYSGDVTYFAPENMALSHHYRFCGHFTGTPSCSELHGQKFLDDTMLRFESNLSSNVNETLFYMNTQITVV